MSSSDASSETSSVVASAEADSASVASLESGAEGSGAAESLSA